MQQRPDNYQPAVTPDTQGDLTMRYPDRRFDDRMDEVPQSPMICERCHASLDHDHWQMDEKRYRRLQSLPDVHVGLCPGCTRVERRLFEGEVTLRHHWTATEKQDVLNLIHHEEARARAINITARIALLEDHGDEIYILTTTQFLAKRIGTEVKKAFHGEVKVTPLPREKFTRVLWQKAA